jgi:hypothetical protein
MGAIAKRFGWQTVVGETRSNGAIKMNREGRTKSRSQHGARRTTAHIPY